jgi:methyl-accepting chemotaxis protein
LLNSSHQKRNPEEGDILAEISAAGVEQSSGVSQVGQAVTQTEQDTQQNAALVEVRSAAAESLREQAQRLV